MDHNEVGRHWNRIASTWTSLARAGHDFYRDALNTPAFLEFLPEVRGLRGLDIGCGEGHNTRLLAEHGAEMTAIDISDIFIHHAAQFSLEEQTIKYGVASAVHLPFVNSAFDFAAGFMSFMNIPELEFMLAEIYRVLKPLGFVQFSISHPCFDTPHRKNLRDSDDITYAIEVGDYFRNLNGDLIDIFGPNSQAMKDGLPQIQIPRFTRTLSQWINAIVESGLTIEKVNEPRPTDEVVRDCPKVQDAQVVAYFLHVRARKPASAEQPG
jgi:ubiquinone/menaquinone biosynthesis C-methylase UbiE